MVSLDYVSREPRVEEYPQNYPPGVVLGMRVCYSGGLRLFIYKGLGA